MQGVEEVQTIQNRKWNTSFGIENRGRVSSGYPYIH